MAMLSFGDFCLDTVNRKLWHGDRPVELHGMPLLVLCHIVERSAAGSSARDSERLFTKQMLRDTVWRDVHVSDETIRGCILLIRKALADDPQQPRYIKTQNKEGWRFLMKVQPQVGTAQPTQIPQPPNGPYDPNWYIPRPQDERELVSCLNHPGRPAVVFGPQGSGKSTLILHSLASASAMPQEADNHRLIRISLRALSAAHLESLDTMLHELGRLLLDPNHEDEARAHSLMAKLWPQALDAKLKLKKLVRDHILTSDRIVYLVLSDVDCLAPWRFQTAWFDMLRAWQDTESLSSLRLILETAIPPRLFPLGGQSPLWTKARRIHVQGFESKQITQMAALYGLHPSVRACEELVELVGGLAVLCRHALYQAAVRQASLEELLKEYDPDRRAFGIFTEHLEDIQQWFERKDLNDLREPLREATQGISLSPESAWPLVRKGLLAETEMRGAYRLRCRLYADFFGRQLR